MARLFEGELADLKLTPEERRAVEAHEKKGWSYNRINAEIFGGRYRGRQGISWIIRKAKRKLLLHERQLQWRGRAHLCPIEETPLPVKVRKQLALNGYRTLGDLPSDLQLTGLGPTYQFLLRKLIVRWKVRSRRADWFCPHCGHEMPSGNASSAVCRNCGVEVQRLAIHVGGADGNLQVELRYQAPIVVA
jgi:hypothetical protein